MSDACRSRWSPMAAWRARCLTSRRYELGLDYYREYTGKVRVVKRQAFRRSPQNLSIHSAWRLPSSARMRSDETR